MAALLRTTRAHRTAALLEVKHAEVRGAESGARRRGIGGRSKRRGGRTIDKVDEDATVDKEEESTRLTSMRVKSSFLYLYVPVANKSMVRVAATKGLRVGISVKANLDSFKLFCL